jgi:hypothetical protein
MIKTERHSNSLKDVILSLSQADLCILLQNAYEILVVEKTPLNTPLERFSASEHYKTSICCYLDEGRYRK